MSKEQDKQLEITIGVKGGIPYIIDNPDNICVKIMDYDVDYVEDNELETDKFGNKYIYDEIQ